MANDNKSGLGRTYDQVTKDGSSSAATMGTGGTGNTGSESGKGGAQQADGGNAQAARTDDLLSDGSEKERNGFVGQGPGELETGMDGIGSVNGGKPGNKQG